MTDRMSLPLAQADPEVAAAIDQETLRQHEGLEMMPAKNFFSEAVLEAAARSSPINIARATLGAATTAAASTPTCGEPGPRPRPQLFGGEHINVQPHSSQANASAYARCSSPGDTISASISRTAATSRTAIASASAASFTDHLLSRPPRQRDHRLRRDGKGRRAGKAKAIIAAPAPTRASGLRPHALDRRQGGRDVYLRHGAYRRLVAGGAHDSPVPHAHITTTTTHKTLRGPRAGLIICKQDLAAAVDKAVFPGQQGGPLVHMVAAKAVSFAEALRPEFRVYAAQIVANAKLLPRHCMQRAFGWSPGTR